jgi:acyl-CoA hydrolase
VIRPPGTVLVAYADGQSAPRISPAEAMRAAGVDGRPFVFMGLTVERHPWLDDPELEGATVIAGYALARIVATGRLTPLGVRLSAVPSILAEHPPAIAVIAGVRRADGYAFAGSVGWGDVLARSAERIVIELDDHGRDLGGPTIDGNVVAVVPRPPGDVTVAEQRPADDVDLRIGALVASLVPDGATLQFGPGGIGEGIARALDRPVHIRSGLLTDAMASLHERGLLAAPATAAYTWGGDPIVRLAEAGMLELVSVTETNDTTRIMGIPRFVACNTALQVGFDGAVNIERIGARVITSIGGHADFCHGASRSAGGLAVIAVRAAAADGTPTIVERPDVVSTPRCDVDVVVTEHGIADLRGLTDPARVLAVRSIAG